MGAGTCWFQCACANPLRPAFSAPVAPAQPPQSGSDGTIADAPPLGKRFLSSVMQHRVGAVAPPLAGGELPASLGWAHGQTGAPRYGCRISALGAERRSWR